VAVLVYDWFTDSHARPMGLEVAGAGGKKQPEVKVKMPIKAGTATIKGKIVFDGDARRGNSPPSIALAPGQSEEFKLRPEEEPIRIECNVHTMMRARLFVYDHPYAVVTKIDGTFELKNVPVGTKLTVEFWHEAKGVFGTTEVTLAEKQTSDLGVIKVGM
jgi:hypothetical protein